MCAGQSQDGKGVPSGSGFELSELMKRRLESVASTGSSASSGFIEDKSYCDSEEEEEGKGWARLASLPHPPSVCASCCPPPRLCSTPPTQERQLPSDCFLRLTDGTFPPPVHQHNRCSRSHCHPTEPRETTVYILSWPDCCSPLRLQLSRVECWCVISCLISCLLRWAGGRTPWKFLSDQLAGPTFHLT